MPKITEVKITLSDTGSESSDKPNAKKKHSRGPHIARRDGEVLSRRKTKKGLNFYDLGQVLAGSDWQTNPFTVTPNVNITSDSPPYGEFSINPLTLANVQSLETAILATELSAFRKIKKSVGLAFPIYIFGETFTISSLDTLPYWTDNGLVLTNDQLHGAFFGIASYSDVAQRTFFATGVDLNDRGSTKVTSMPSNDAADVAFALSASASIYLMPMLNQHIGRSFTTAGAFPIIGRTVIYNAMYRIRPRDFESPGKVFEYLGGNLPYNASSFNAALANSTPLMPTRTQSLVIYGNGNPGTLTPSGSFPTGDASLEFRNDLRFDFTSPIAGQLVGMVRQGGATFYFWQV